MPSRALTRTHALTSAFSRPHARARDLASLLLCLTGLTRVPGNHQLVEVCYSNLKEYDKMSFLFLVTGKYEKLEKMMGIAQNRGDNISRFHNSLYTANVEERIRILAELGYL